MEKALSLVMRTRVYIPRAHVKAEQEWQLPVSGCSGSRDRIFRTAWLAGVGIRKGREVGSVRHPVSINQKVDSNQGRHPHQPQDPCSPPHRCIHTDMCAHIHTNTCVDVYIPHTSTCAKIKKGKKRTKHKMAVFIRIQPPFQGTVEPDAMIMKVYLNGRCEATLGVMV